MAYGIKPTHDSAIAKATRRRYMGYGWCGRCGYPWATVNEHVTEYVDDGGYRGIFPLCEECWKHLGCAAARAPYYGTLLGKWWRSGSTIDMKMIEAIALALDLEPAT